LLLLNGMTKILKPFSICLFLFVSLFTNKVKGQQTYELHVHCVDYDSAFVSDVLNIQTSFNSQDACRLYLAALPQTLKNKGFVTASIDSLKFDSLSAHMVLYAGNIYQWSQIDTDEKNNELLQS